MQTLTVFTLHMIMPATLRSQLISSIGALVQPTRVQPGCLGCQLYIDYDDENAITLIEEWSSRDELTRYLQSDVHKTLVAALDLSTEMPQVRIDTIIRKEDLSIIAGLDNSDQAS